MGNWGRILEYYGELYRLSRAQRKRREPKKTLEAGKGDR